MRNLIVLFALFILNHSFSQVAPNEDFYKNLSTVNKVDSIFVLRNAITQYDLVQSDVFQDLEMEISSRGALIDVLSSAIIENFQYQGGEEVKDVLKFENGKALPYRDKKVYLYHDKNSKRKSYFYYFSDQPNLIYRKVSKSKKSDIVVYFISKKE